MLSKRYIEPIQIKVIFSGIIISVDCKSEFNRIFFSRQNCNLRADNHGVHIMRLFKDTYCKDSMYSMYKDKLQNCSLNQFE